MCDDVLSIVFVFCPGPLFSQSKLIPSVGAVSVVCELVSTLACELVSFVGDLHVCELVSSGGDLQVDCDSF